MPETQWFDDHVIDEDGKRYALSVPYYPDACGPIPECLLMTPEQRRAGWEGKQLTDSYRGGNAEAWRERERQRRKQIREEKRVKDAKSLANLKAKHIGERYDKKQKVWVKDDAYTEQGLEGDPSHEGDGDAVPESDAGMDV